MDDDRVAAFNDLALAIGMLRSVFLRHGMKPPFAIELGSHEDGDLFRYIPPCDIFLGEAQAGRNGLYPDIVGRLMDIEIRRPAKFRATRRVGYDII